MLNLRRRSLCDKCITCQKHRFWFETILHRFREDYFHRYKARKNLLPTISFEKETFDTVILDCCDVYTLLLNCIQAYFAYMPITCMQWLSDSPSLYNNNFFPVYSWIDMESFRVYGLTLRYSKRLTVNGLEFFSSKVDLAFVAVRVSFNFCKSGGLMKMM